MFLMCFQPAFSLVHLRGKGDGVIGAALHFLLQQPGGGFRLLFWRFDNQFIVHCENQPTLQALPADPLPDPDHGQLNHIRCRPLNGGVSGHALSGAADLEIAVFQFRQGPPPAEEGSGIALLPGLLDHALHIGIHRREGGQIAL